MRQIDLSTLLCRRATTDPAGRQQMNSGAAHWRHRVGQTFKAERNNLAVSAADRSSQQ